MGWRGQVALLGVVTVGAYGLVLYGFGAFVADIHDDTGWATGAIAAAFSIATLGGGMVSLGSGWVLDRVGGQPVMAVGLAVGSAFVLVASAADSVAVFVAAWGLGGAMLVASLFYNVTMAITARIVEPALRGRAFTLLTVLGGLSAPISLPLAGALVNEYGWRIAVRLMVVFVVMCCLPAVVLVRGDRYVVRGGASAEFPGIASVSAALATLTVRRWLLSCSAGLAGLVAIQVHHVGAIEATGIGIAAAGTLAGIRGLLSLPGRAAASSIAARVGVVNALRLTYATMTLGTLALVFAGPIGWVWVFVVVTGVAFGSESPLQGLYAAELYGQRRIGTLMGMQQIVFGIAGALGPLVLGLTVDLTGDYQLMLICAVALQLVALITFRDPGPLSEPDPLTHAGM